LFIKYPLIMITGARSQLFFHSEHRNIPWLREKEPDPLVEIHPETARKFNIYDGEWLYIKNDLGRVKRKAKLTLKVHPEQIQTLHGWWLPERKGPEPDLFGVWDYQINQLIPGPQCSTSGFGGGQYKTTLVTLEKIAAGGDNNG
jgi:anaerobic selenocysteine-containing dehydrogenase